MRKLPPRGAVAFAHPGDGDHPSHADARQKIERLLHRRSSIGVVVAPFRDVHKHGRARVCQHVRRLRLGVVPRDGHGDRAAHPRRLHRHVELRPGNRGYGDPRAPQRVRGRGLVRHHLVPRRTLASVVAHRREGGAHGVRERVGVRQKRPVRDFDTPRGHHRDVGRPLGRHVREPFAEGVERVPSRGVGTEGSAGRDPPREVGTNRGRRPERREAASRDREHRR
mmetsp:Transcript_14136/g.57503  ORF Transcript_14136/g.57503 Transcript_14136/m.57503 type:complete len:224 (-) Transcript_14136:69-740(-)